MGVFTEYKGMSIEIDDLDRQNLDYFGFCAAHDFRLQRCTACSRLRYPPSTACPWCAELTSDWTPVEGRGTVHSYTEIVHATQPGFKPDAPYLVLLVDLDVQKGEPTEHEALRVVGNLTAPDGEIAPASIAATVGIGTRVRMTFTDVAPGFSLPQWTIDTDAEQPERPWRYPD